MEDIAEAEIEKEPLEIILEDIRTKLGLVLEGQAVLREEVRKMRRDLSQKLSALLNRLDDALAQGADQKSGSRVFDPGA
jgi:hypothetical protein